MAVKKDALHNEHFHQHTIQTLQQLNDTGMQLPKTGRHAYAYGVLHGYVEQLLVDFSDAFSPEQLDEIHIVLDSLSHLVGDDERKNQQIRSRLQTLRGVRDGSTQ